MDYSAMTREELEAKKDEARERKLEARAEMKAMREAMDAKVVEEKAEKIYDKLSASEKAALKQVIKVKGIESAEAVGTPSAG